MDNSNMSELTSAISSVDAHPLTGLVEQICQYIKQSQPETPGLVELGERFGVSPYHLQRTFKQITGISPLQFSNGLRVDQFKLQVRKGQSITSALYDAGFGSSSRLYERTDAHLGMTPSTYQNSGEGVSIFYSVVDSPLGKLLVGVTDRGICKISLGDTESVLVEELHREFACAEEIVRDDDGLGFWIGEIVHYLDGSQPHLDLPLDIRATAFQQRVWKELQQIPVGETRSYGEIAEAIGQPKAARAVARACSSNPTALVIPCHRIIPASGKVGGYRWGVERKEAILAQEKQYQQEMQN